MLLLFSYKPQFHISHKSGCHRAITHTNNFFFKTESGNILITLSKNAYQFSPENHTHTGHVVLTILPSAKPPPTNLLLQSLYTSPKNSYPSSFQYYLELSEKTSIGIELTFSFSQRRVANCSLILLSASCESSTNSSTNSPPPFASNSTSTASPVLSLISAGPCSCPLLLSFNCASGPFIFIFFFFFEMSE
ncbi:hypothetical protein C2G38_1576931 [Gigaspora rosea]|uniref:Uncharacterized protein n=1 Tax=Gigaspora rosea TaxID=44941 RepID=A0A397UZ15_9GLOM|nr:hypothetical protein C2G38_1576931 [Gigaspora rosea]